MATSSEIKLAAEYQFEQTRSTQAHLQDSCPHRRMDGTSAVVSQRASDQQTAHSICLFCQKRFEVPLVVLEGSFEDRESPSWYMDDIRKRLSWYQRLARWWANRHI